MRHALAFIAAGVVGWPAPVAAGGQPEAVFRSWSRVVREGGAIIFVDRGHPHEASRRALCNGLAEIEQRHAGRAIITSGLVSHLAPLANGSAASPALVAGSRLDRRLEIPTVAHRTSKYSAIVH
jgi:hypothetical protein